MTDLNPGDQAQWTWGQGNPTGTVTEIADHGSLSIKSAKGNTITRNADPSNPAVHLQQDSGTDVVKRASELEKLSDSDTAKQTQDTDKDKDKDKDTPDEKGSKKDKNLRKPFPKPRQSAPITRPADTEEEKEEAELSLDEQAKLAEQKDRDAGAAGGQTTIHGHANGEKASEEVTKPAENLMDIRGEIQAREPSPEKQPNLEASVGEKRGRSEDSPAPSSDEQLPTSGSAENGEVEKDVPEDVPEPETKKPRVEEPVTDPSGAVPTESEAKSAETAESSEPPKKKAGRPKKEETKTGPGERKNSISSRTRSKATAEDVSI